MCSQLRACCMLGDSLGQVGLRIFVEYMDTEKDI